MRRGRRKEETKGRRERVGGGIMRGDISGG
jgi:hypothetical protein